MKINTAFKLSALAAALSVSVPAFAATTISGTGFIPVTGNNTGNSITLNAGTTVNGTLAAGNTTVGTLAAGNTTVTGDTTISGTLTVGTTNIVQAIGDGDATTLASANSYADAGDAAITAGIATGVTTASLTVNGPSQLNGNLTVNGGASNILNAGTISAGADLIIPTVNAAFAGTTQSFNQDRVDTQDQTRTVDAQVINENKFQLTTSEQVGQQTWTTSQSATADYDALGVIVSGSLTGPVLGATIDNGFVATTVDKVQDLTLGRNNPTEDYQLSISKTDNGVTNSTTVNASGISTGQITLAGQDLATTIANGDAATLASANLYTDGQVANEAAARAAADTQLQANIDTEAATRSAADTALNTRVDTEAATRAAADVVLQDNINAEAATRSAADTVLNTRVDTEAATRAAADVVLQDNINAEAVTRSAADTALNTRVDTEAATRAAADVVLQDNINAEAATRAAGLAAAATDRQAIRSEFANGDVATLASANSYADAGDATTLASANSYADAGDAAITAGIATGVTTASLTVNGPSQLNGNLTVNGGASNILNAGTISAGADLIIPTVNAAFAGTTQSFNQDRVDTQDQTRTVDAQVINENKFQLTTSEQVGQQTWTTSQSATADYDALGVIVSGSLTGPVLGATIDNGFVATTVDKVQDLTLGRNNPTEDYQLSISKTDNGVTNSTTVNASGISTGQITLAGQDLATTIANGDAATLASANLYTDGQVANEAAARAAADTQLQANIDTEAATRSAADTALNTRVDTEAATRAAADVVLQDNINAEAATRSAADTVLNTRVDTEAATRAAADVVLQDNINAEAVTRSAADTALNTRVDTEAATRAAADVVLQDNINAEAATRAAGLAAAATDRQAIRSEFANGDVATLASANAYTNTQVANVNSRVNQLNTRVDDVEKTSYRGIAIALAAQQQIPNIGAGQFAVFGGVGHYEGESAGALGVASVFADGRTSVSAAVGFAGGNEVGGRVGVSYVFGGK